MSGVGRHKFVLVSFDDGTISLVSSLWLIGDGQCYWPPTNQTKLAQKHAAVDETWLKCSCRILATSDSFDRIREKEKRAEETSNIDTGNEEPTTTGRYKRRTKRPSRFVESHDDASSDSPEDACKKLRTQQSITYPVMKAMYKNSNSELNVAVDRVNNAELNGAIDQAIEAELIEENGYALNWMSELDVEKGSELNESMEPQNDPEFNAVSDQETASKWREAEAIDPENDRETCEPIHQEINHQMGVTITREDDCELNESIDKDNNPELNEALDQENSDQGNSFNTTNSSDSQSDMETEITDHNVAIRPLKKVYDQSYFKSKQLPVAMGKQHSTREMLATGVFTQKSKSVPFVTQKLLPSAMGKKRSSSGVLASAVLTHKSKSVSSAVAVAKKQPPAATEKQGSTSGMQASKVFKQKSQSVASTVVTVTKEQVPAAIGMQVCNSVTMASDVLNRTTKCVPGASAVTRKPPPAGMEKQHSSIRNTPVSGISTPASARQSGASPSENRPVVVGSSLSQGGFQTTVIHILAKIRSDMKNLTDQINDMSASVRSLVDGELEDTDLELPDGLILPMASLAHMDLMAASLVDATFRKRLIARLYIIGGKTLENVVYGQLKFLLDVPLQRTYNWCGQKGKLCFGKLQLASVVQKAVRKNPKYKTATDRDIQDKCASFFTNSCDRKKKTEEQNYCVEEQNWNVESDSE